jgi:hypothetical protein
LNPGEFFEAHVNAYSIGRREWNFFVRGNQRAGDFYITAAYSATGLRRNAEGVLEGVVDVVYVGMEGTNEDRVRIDF